MDTTQYWYQTSLLSRLYFLQFRKQTIVLQHLRCSFCFLQITEVIKFQRLQTDLKCHYVWTEFPHQHVSFCFGSKQEKAQVDRCLFSKQLRPAGLNPELGINIRHKQDQNQWKVETLQLLNHKTKCFSSSAASQGKFKLDSVIYNWELGVY